MKNKALLLLTAVLVLMTTACPNPVNEDSGPSSAKDITAFTFAAADNASLSSDITATISGTAISVDIPSTANETSLAPSITHSGESISPVSGTARDFSGAVTYTVTAEDDTTKEYTVTPTTVYEGDDRIAVLESYDYWEGNSSSIGLIGLAFYGDADSDEDRDVDFNNDYSDTNWVGFGGINGETSYTYDAEGMNAPSDEVIEFIRLTDDYLRVQIIPLDEIVTLYPKSL